MKTKEPWEPDIVGFIRDRITSFAFTNVETCKAIAEEIRNTHAFMTADPLKGNSIEQHFGETFIDLAQTPLLKYEFDELQTCLHMSKLLKGVSFNTFMAQQYTPVQGVGISRHRDGDRFQDVIAVLVLEDGGEFWVYDNAAGDNPRKLDVSIGDIIVFDNTVYHAVLNVCLPRFTVTARIDLMPEKKW